MDLYRVRNELNAGHSIYDLPLKVTYYARVSTDKDEQLHSIKNQIDYYEEYIRANSNWTFASGYVDEGLSGTSVAKRESFLRMVDDAKLGKFDFIITKEISRFSRNTLDSIHYTQQLLSYGVGVLFQSDNINTLMPDAELRLTIMSSIAQDEVRKISERVKFGFKRAIEKGVVLGNNCIWGYTKDAGKLVIVEEEAEIVRKIFDIYANQNMGMRSICNWLAEQGCKNTHGNNFSFSTIKRILTNPKYKGYYCGNKTHKYDYKLSDVKYLDEAEWVMYKDESGEIVPAIVSEEIWDKANFILTKRSLKQSSENKSAYASRYTYSGKIICMEHNQPYYRSNYKYKSGSKEVWQCKLYSEKGKAGCDSPTIYTTELDEVMKQAAKLIIENKSDIIHDLVKIYSEIGSKSKIKEDIAKYRVEINNLLKMKDKLLDLSIKGKISDDEFESRNERFNSEMQDMKEEITDLEAQGIKNAEVANSVETLRKLIADELNFDEGLGYSLTDSLLDRVEVYKTVEKSVVKIKVFFKVINEALPFNIERGRGKVTSVRCTSYVSMAQMLLV